MVTSSYGGGHASEGRNHDHNHIGVGNVRVEGVELFASTQAHQGSALDLDLDLHRKTPMSCDRGHGHIQRAPTLEWDETHVRMMQLILTSPRSDSLGWMALLVLKCYSY